MTPPSSHYIEVDAQEIHITEWGNPDHPKIVMWHGLARTGRDFDPLARHLSDHFHILCPDTIGRGLSCWASEPDKQYCFEFYEKIAKRLFQQFEIETCDFIGTSMGGALGIRLASSLLKSRIKSLVINDIAPQIAHNAVKRILEYVSQPPTFSKITELEDYLRTVYAPYGFLSDRQWRHMTETSARRLGDGQITLHYDPKITHQFVNYPDDFNIWKDFESLQLPLLVLRGENSDLFLKEWAEKMKSKQPNMEFVEIPNCGHAPALNIENQYKIITRFLEKSI